MKSNKMKKVLIAIDYDPTAQKVAEIGHSFATGMDAEIVLLHVISNPANYSSTGHITVMGFSGMLEPNTLQLDGIDALKKAAHEFLNKTKQHLADKTIHTKVLEGDIAESILNVAKDEKVYLIVMGSHSHKWLEKIVMGSVAEKVMQHTVTPLLIIPTKQIMEE